MLRANSRTLPIEDIKIPEAFAQTTPRREKVDKAKAFYGVTGQFDKPMLIDRKGYIFDGYARLIAAKEMGLDKVPVVQIVPFEHKKKAEEPTEKKTKFKVGDRVKSTLGRTSGKIGNVLGYAIQGPHGNCNVLVEFEEFTSGHDGFGDVIPRGKNGRCYYCFEDELVPCPSPSFDWDAFQAGKITVHCDTEEKAKAFLKECEERGYKWSSNDSPSSFTAWESYTKNTCYISEARHLEYSPSDFYKGSGYTIIDYPFSEQPEAEDKPEPVKLYCTGNGSGLHTIKKGDICEFDSDGYFHFPDGEVTGMSYKNMEEFCDTNQGYAEAKFVPLVKRPAKVGEWVLLDCDDCFSRNKQGDVVEVVTVSGGKTFIKDPTGKLSYGICTLFEDKYTYVLDGYHPEPKADKDPEYYSGKVVCVETDGFFTAGKVYEFCNGLIKSNTGDSYNKGEPIKSLDDLNDGTWLPKFIEFKGEAND